ncbi:30S ribosomal protein S17 [Patescibacteria group bacterium]|nr:30S ribosomal protein S17 [Patescibacteria group bacterium]
MKKDKPTIEDKEVIRKKLTGEVVSDKMDKTVVVMVKTIKAHPKYKKRYQVSTKYHAHDPENKHKEGEKVTIVLDRPRSKNKRWRIVESK